MSKKKKNRNASKDGENFQASQAGKSDQSNTQVKLPAEVVPGIKVLVVMCVGVLLLQGMLFAISSFDIDEVTETSDEQVAGAYTYKGDFGCEEYISFYEEVDGVVDNEDLEMYLSQTYEYCNLEMDDDSNIWFDIFR